MTRGLRSGPAGTLPFRGEVWDARFPAPVGEHPVVVLTSNALIPRVSAVTVVVVTGTEGPPVTHVPLDADSGVTKYPVSWANAADIHAVPKSKLSRLRGRLAADELARLEEAIRGVLVL